MPRVELTPSQLSEARVIAEKAARIMEPIPLSSATLQKVLDLLKAEEIQPSPGSVGDKTPT